MSEPTTQQPLASNLVWMNLWYGRGAPATLWRTLLKGVLTLTLVPITYTLALSTVRWGWPLQLLGWMLLILTAFLIYVGGRALIVVVRQMGMKRLLLRLLIFYVVAVIVVALLVPSGQQGFQHWMSSAGNVFVVVAQVGSGITDSIISAPDEVRFAATGKRSIDPVDGVIWPDGVAPTPFVISFDSSSTEGISSPSAESTTSLALVSDADLLQVGTVVQVVNTDGLALRARASPSQQSEIVARFSAGSRLTIVEGPVEADGYVWWRVHADAGEGWCAAAFLKAIER